MSLPVKCRVTSLRVTFRELVFFVCLTFDDFVGWAAHQTIFSVACNSVFEIQPAFQAVETVVRTRKHYEADKFSKFSVGWTGQGFCRDLDPC